MDTHLPALPGTSADGHRARTLRAEDPADQESWLIRVACTAALTLGGLAPAVGARP